MPNGVDGASSSSTPDAFRNAGTGTSSEQRSEIVRSPQASPSVADWAVTSAARSAITRRDTVSAYLGTVTALRHQATRPLITSIVAPLQSDDRLPAAAGPGARMLSLSCKAR